MSTLSESAVKLKIAAIDAFMAERQHFRGWAGMYQLLGFLPQGHKAPNDDTAAGGGEFVGSEGSISYTSSFDEIRSYVDAALAPWEDLPDGSKCSDPETDYYSVRSTLGESGAGNPSRIYTNAETIKGEIDSDHIKGAFATPFYKKYRTQLLDVVDGVAVASGTLGTCYEVQKAFWSSIETDVIAICEAATAAFSARSSGLQEVTLTAINAVLGIASVATGRWTPGTAVSSLANLSQKMVSGASDLDKKISVSGSDYESIAESFTTALESLRSIIGKHEKAVKTKLGEAEAEIQSSLKDFNLDCFPFGDYDLNGELEIGSEAEAMVGDAMDRIIETLNKAKKTFDEAPPGSNPVPRNSSLTADPDLVHNAAVSLHNLVAQCLSGTAAEYARGKTLFRSVVADYNATDENAAQTFTNLTRALEQERLNEMMGG